MGLFGPSSRNTQKDDVEIEDIKRKLRQLDMKIININRRIDRIDNDLDSLFEEPPEEEEPQDYS